MRHSGYGSASSVGGIDHRARRFLSSLLHPVVTARKTNIAEEINQAWLMDLLIAKGIDRIQPRSTPSRIKSKKDRDGTGDSER